MSYVKKTENENLISLVFRGLARYKELDAELYEDEKKNEVTICFADRKGKEVVLKIDSSVAKSLHSEHVSIIIPVYNYKIKIAFTSSITYLQECNYKLHLPGSIYLIIDDTSRYVFDYGESACSFEIEDYTAFKDFISIKYPDLKFYHEVAFEEILNLYEQSGFLSLKAEDEMIRNFKTMMDCMDDLKYRHTLALNLGYYTEKLISGASIVRIYEKTYLGQSLASIPQARFNFKSKADVYLGLIDSMLSNECFGYYLAYFDARSKWHGGMYKEFGNFIDDSSKYFYDEMCFYEFDITAAQDISIEASEITIQDLSEQSDEFVEYCRNYLSTIETGCYGYSPECFTLGTTKEAFKCANMKLERKLWCLKEEGRRIAYIVGEVYPEGINLFNLLDMCRIYFVDGKMNKKAVIKAGLPCLIEFYRSFNKEKFNVFYKYNTQSDFVEDSGDIGLNHPILAGRVIFNTDGVLEYSMLLRLLYGL